MTHLDRLDREYPVRRTPAQKEAFRNYIAGLPCVNKAGVRFEKTSDGRNDNIVIGDPQKAKVVFTAHYDTPAASVFPNLMIPRNKLLFWLYQFLPLILIIAFSLGVGYAAQAVAEGDRRMFLLGFLVVYYLLYFLMYRTFINRHNRNDNTSGVATLLSIADRIDTADAAFILFDNEEKGKKGSKAYFKGHRDFMQDKLVINFDCVGNGGNIVFISKEGAQSSAEYQALTDTVTSEGNFEVSFFPIKGSESNSDHKSFPRGIGCMACKRTKGGTLYTPYIHTFRDTAASNDNVDFIANAMERFIKRI